ncbi:AAA family ATPase [Methylobacterium sp. Leaf465]|uniref:AAA family ATPase n=1 Tax=Methylobacterium sp. Leaf465 TaxID=1736385 RepID=UPI001FCDC7EB|nr:AAA family ATPase [Methylobacterium sp. Leaf465]
MVLIGMYDVDYLLAATLGEAPGLERSVIYRYRTGVLRMRVFAVLQVAAAKLGREVSVDPDPLAFRFVDGGLYESMKLYEWPRRVRGAAAPASTIRSTLWSLLESANGPSIHFLPYAAVPHGWEEVEHSCLIVEEPAITRSTLHPVLCYLAATTDLASNVDFPTEVGFVESFAELVDEGADLPAIMQAFDERVLLCTDPTTNRFDTALHHREVVRREGHQSPLRHLRDLIGLHQERDAVDLICAFDERRWVCGWTAHEFVVELYRIAVRLLDLGDAPGTVRSSRRSHVSTFAATEGAILWAALLLASEDALLQGLREERDCYRRGPDLLVTSLAVLGQDFLVRAPRAGNDDALDGRWSSLDRALNRCRWREPDDRLATARDALAHALTSTLARRPAGMRTWITRLHAESIAAVAWIEPCHCGYELRNGVRSAVAKAPAQEPRTFGAVIGRAHTVEALRRHARRKNDGVGLLLYGPKGVGKRTLARLYARAVLCELPDSGGSPCGTCATCLGFDDGSPGYCEVDGSDIDVAHHTAQIIELARMVEQSSMLTPHCVFVVRNADRYPPEVFDALLQPMEANPRVSFVLLASDPNAVRLAGRSRCFDYCVRRLERLEAEVFVRQTLAADGLACDEATLALLVDAGDGLPGRLSWACSTAAHVLALGVDATRKVLGLDWADNLVAAWPNLAGGKASALTDLMRASGTDRFEQIRRLRALLQRAYLDELLPSSVNYDALDPALRNMCKRSAAAPVAFSEQSPTTDVMALERLLARYSN